MKGEGWRTKPNDSLICCQIGYVVNYKLQNWLAYFHDDEMSFPSVIFSGSIGLAVEAR